MKNKLIIMCGIPFSGKSTLAAQLSKLYNYKHVDLDVIKTQFIENDISDSLITQSTWDRIYDAMYQKIRELLSDGLNVVHDTGNFTRYERSLVSKIAREQNIPVTTIYVDTTRSTAYKRMIENRTTKTRFDITDEAFNGAVSEMEIPTTDENTIAYNDGEPVERWAAKNHLIP